MVEGNRARYKSVERIGVGGAGEGDRVAPRRNSLANQSAAGAWTGTERHRAAREKVGGGTGNRQDNLERERERDDGADGGVSRAVLWAGRRGTATSGVNSAARSSAREYVAVVGGRGK